MSGVTTVRAKALRGFCVAVGKYAEPGEIHDLPLSLFQILASGGSVEAVHDEAPAAEGDAPAVAGKTKPGAKRA